MLKHADWKKDALGTVISENPVEIKLANDGSDFNYWVEFDEPQFDLTDELNGDLIRSYDSATVAGRFLRAI